MVTYKTKGRNKSMKRSSRNPSKNVLRRIYAFALGAALSTVAISAYRATTPGVQESPENSVSTNTVESVSMMELEEKLLSSEPYYLEMSSMFDTELMTGEIFRRTESQEQEETEEFPQEFVDDLFAQVDVSEAVEEDLFSTEYLSKWGELTIGDRGEWKD